MAFEGYLLKVGEYEFPLQHIEHKTYSVKKQVILADKFSNANGRTTRDVLDHYTLDVSFNTCASLTNTDVNEIMTGIRNNYSVEKERKASVTVYVPELDGYVTQDMFLSDPQFNIISITKDNKINYDKIKFQFNGY